MATGTAPAPGAPVPTAAPAAQTGSSNVVTNFITSTKIIGPVVVLVVIFLGAAGISPASNAGFASDALALTAITGGAVAIERILELFWTVMGFLKGSWWPMSSVGDEINKWVQGLDSTLAPLYTDATAALEELEKNRTWAKDKLDAAHTDLEAMQARIQQLKKLAPDNQRVELIAAAAFQNVSYIQKQFPNLQHGVDVAHQAITGLQDFVATFKDNPGKRLISIYIGVILGMVGAGPIGLDLFQAAGATQFSLPLGIGNLSLHLSVALTGLVMGLGSNPTHEVIRAIQEYKKSQRLDNAPSPTTSNAGTQPSFALIPGEAGQPFRGGPRANSGVDKFQLRSKR